MIIGAKPGEGGLKLPLESKMAHRRNTHFRAEPPPGTPKLPLDFEKFGAPDHDNIGTRCVISQNAIEKIIHGIQKPGKLAK